MENQLSEDLSKLIQDHLPAKVAGEMKTFIQQAQETKVAYENLQKTYYTALDNLNDTKDLVRKQDEIEAKLNNALLIEEGNRESKRQMEIEKLKHELLCAKERGNDIKDLVSILMKNPRSIEMINNTRNVPVWETYTGGGGFHTYKPETEFGTNEKTETKE